MLFICVKILPCFFFGLNDFVTSVAAANFIGELKGADSILFDLYINLKELV